MAQAFDLRVPDGRAMAVEEGIEARRCDFEQAESALQEIKRVYAGRIPKLTMGCDFNFWTPLPTVAMKNEMRKKLNILEGKKVFLRRVTLSLASS